MKEEVENLTKQVAEQAEQRSVARLLRAFGLMDTRAQTMSFLVESHWKPRRANIGSCLRCLAERVCESEKHSGLRSTDFGPDRRVLHVRRSIWRGQEQEPKTSNAVRVVDIPELLAKELREYVSGVNGYIFATKDGKPLQQRNVLRALHTRKTVGFHAFRRFRLTWLRKSGAPKDMERYWMGHAPEGVGDLYSKLKDDAAFRQEWAERIGLGFELVHVGTQTEVATKTQKVA